MFLYETGDKWKENCPPLEDLARKLIEKSRLTSTSLIKVRNPDGTYYFTLDAEIIRSVAKKLFGKLQRIDESEPPPVTVYKRLVETLPGIVACMHARYYYEYGKLKNEVYSLEGAGGVGKSSYVYWLVRMIGGIMVNDEESFEKALEILLSEGKWVPILVLDDIGAIISKYWFITRSERHWANVFKLLEYAKDFTGLILMTERSFRGIAKKLRELSSLDGELRRMIIGEYIIDYIIWRKPDRKAALYFDVLWPGLTIDNRDWDKMINKRREIAINLLERFKQARREREEQ